MRFLSYILNMRSYQESLNDDFDDHIQECHNR